MKAEERIKHLDQELITLGPETHRLKTQVLPQLLQQCRIFRKAGQHQDANALADQIEIISVTVKSNELRLRALEP